MNATTPPTTLPTTTTRLPFDGTTPMTLHSWRAPTVLGVWAHPDDETYLSAALMHRVVAAGGRALVVSATRGEGGSDDAHIDRHTLARRRTNELRTAMRELGVTETEFLDHPDGGCAAVGDEVAVPAIERAILRARPHLVVTFGPDGITGHPDHVAVHRWTTAAWRNVCGWPGTLPLGAQLLYATMTHDFVERHRREYADLPLSLEGEPQSVPSSDVAVRIEPTDEERRRKAAALDAHASQTVVLAELLGRERFHGWWCDETFRHPTTVELDAVAVTPSPHRLQTGSKSRRHDSVTVAP